MCDQYIQSPLIVTTKRCSKCKRDLPREAFSRNSAQPDGCEIYCKECRSAYRRSSTEEEREQARIKGRERYAANRAKIAAQERVRRVKNRERIADQRRTRYAANREERRAQRRQYYTDHRETIIADVHRYRLKNPDKVRESSRRYYAANRDAVKAMNKRWIEANREVRREHGRRRAAWQKAGIAAPFTLEQLQQKWAYWDDRCWMCGEPATTIDHVKPLSKGGRDVLANLRPACRKCNCSKGSKWPFTRIRNIPKWD